MKSTELLKFIEEKIAIALEEKKKKKLYVEPENKEEEQIEEMSSMGGGSAAFAPAEREKIINEIKMRKVIRTILESNKEKEKKELNELKKIIRKYVNEATEKDVHPKTSINILETLLRDIIETIRESYSSLTTDAEQRNSFRAFFLTNIEKLLAQQDTLDIEKSQEGTLGESDPETEIFIDVEDDDKEEKNDVTKDDFDNSLQGEPYNETGRNVAFECFEKIKNQVQDAYAKISENDIEDRRLFAKYLLLNLDKYFDKFDSELTNTK